MFANLHRLFSRYVWLLVLAAVVVLYMLGAGIARYLGAPFDWGVYWLGKMWVVSFHLGVYLLTRYFDLQLAIEKMGKKLFDLLPYRSGLLLGSASFMTVAASLTVLLISSGRLTPPTFTTLIIGVLGGVFYATPPVQLASRGYGELTIAVLLSNILPLFAFLLQFGEFHRVLAMATFPITLLLLALTLIFDLPHYATRVKYQKSTLAVRMGWENAMIAHNILVLGAFLLVGLAAIFGFPSFATFPALLPLPLGLLQVWYVARIANGAKPNWNALSLSAVALVGFMAYVMNFAFWTH